MKYFFITSQDDKFEKYIIILTHIVSDKIYKMEYFFRKIEKMLENAYDIHEHLEQGPVL